MDILGYIASLLIGVSLGLIGAGGSILTVPVLVYLFGVPVLTATSYSLFVVGITSLLGAGYQYREGRVQMKVALLFCSLSGGVVFAIRSYVLPRIDDSLIVVGGVPLTYSLLSLVLFSLLMLMAAVAMIRPARSDGQPATESLYRLLGCSTLVGVVTGFLGAGGGFILIPSLVLFLGLPMKKAVGTSLFIIAVNSLLGFALDVQHGGIEWRLLGVVTAIATLGMVLGALWGRKVSPSQLKVSFGWFVLVVGMAILVKELLSFLIQSPYFG